MIKLIQSAIVFAVAFYVLALAALYFLQDRLLFPAPHALITELPAPAEFAEMKTSDGALLRHVRFEADDGAPKLMFFHGNGSLAPYEVARGRQLHENGFDVLLVEYRGYGGSSGTPTGNDLLKDSLEVYDWYKERDDEWIFLYAHSLGTGVASYLSSQREVQSIVLEAPYSSLSDVAADRYPIFPVKALFKHEIDSGKFLQESKLPMLLLHGDQDAIIPYNYGRQLFDRLDPQTASWKLLPGIGHNNLVQNGSVDLAIDHFVKSF
ncbi:MAG: alpha/beta hydrolase [Rhizobiaceae bacterium]|nr:alpha/beta hydrolase [Rhizobiaceae bacterium]